MTWLNNTRNDLVVGTLDFPIIQVACPATSYTKVTGSDLTVPKHMSQYSAFTKGKVSLTWGNITASQTPTTYYQIRDQAGNVLATAISRLLNNPASNAAWAYAWAIEEDAWFSIPSSVTSISIYQYSTGGGTTGVTLATATLLLAEIK